MLKVIALHSSPVLMCSTFHMWSDISWKCFAVELQCSWILMSGISTLRDHWFCAFVLTFHDLFWHTEQGHATVKFAIAQVTVSLPLRRSLSVCRCAGHCQFAVVQVTVSLPLHRSLSVCYCTCHCQFAVAQVTLCTDKLCCALCGVQCFCYVWTEIFFSHLMHYLLSVIAGILLKTNFHAFSFWDYFMFLLLVFHKVMELNRHLTLRFCSVVVSWIMQSLTVVDWNWYFGWSHFFRLHLYPDNIGNMPPQTVGTHAGNHCLNWSASFHTSGSLPYKLL